MKIKLFYRAFIVIAIVILQLTACNDSKDTVQATWGSFSWDDGTVWQ